MKIMRIGDLCTYAPKSQIKAGEAVDGAEYMFFTSSADESKRYSDYQFDGEGIIMGTGGNATLHYYSGKYATSTDCVVLLPNEQVRCKYLYYFFKANMKVLEAGFKGAGLKHTNKKYIDNICIEHIPNYGIQDKVIRIFDEVQSVIDSRKEELLLLDDLIRARFVELFENGDYKTEKLGSVCTKITDGTHKTPTYLDEGITFISAKNIVNGELDFSDVKHISEEEYQEIQKRCQTAIYDILLSKSGSLGAPVIVKTEEKLGLFESLAVIKYDREKLLPEFLCEQLKTDRIQRQFTTGTKGVAIKHLHLGVIAETDVIVPPIEEQRQFADFVKQVNKSKFQKYNATILSHNIYVFETRRRFICKPTLII